MSILRNRRYIASGIFIAVIVAIIMVYFNYLSPQHRAKYHLDFVHKSINEMHPAILEPDATAFLDWHKNGYQKARELLLQVHTEADEAAVLRFYMAGYQDPHVNGYWDKRPYSKIDAKEDLWAGFVLAAKTNGYFVQYRKNGEQYPPENAKILSCDQQPIDELLKQHFSPYFDLRWHILKARDYSAKALTLMLSNTGILNRPQFATCDFLINNNINTYTIYWSTISEIEATHIAENYYSPYRLPLVTRLDEDTHWINVSDFQLNTPEAVESQTQLLTELLSINEMNTVILDTRGNQGGNSTHGFDILSAIFSKDPEAKNYFLNHLQLKSQGSSGLFRVSWQFYWSYDYMLNKTIAIQGAQSEQTLMLQDLLIRLKNALNRGEKSFYQAENSEHNNMPAPDDNWKSHMKLVLITDRHCMSSCLDFVDWAKLIPNLLHLGEPTDADTIYTQVADMQSKYFSESFIFRVPIKTNKRQREDNKPYIPDVIYEGNINDDKLLKPWVFNQIEQHFNTPVIQD